MAAGITALGMAVVRPIMAAVMAAAAMGTADMAMGRRWWLAWAAGIMVAVMTAAAGAAAMVADRGMAAPEVLEAAARFTAVLVALVQAAACMVLAGRVAGCTGPVAVVVVAGMVLAAVLVVARAASADPGWRLTALLPAGILPS